MKLLKYILTALVCIILAKASAMAQAAPNTISNLVQWFDAQDINNGGAQPANGAAISTWSDKSGSGLNLTSTAGGNDPTFDDDGWNAANNCPAAYFNANHALASGDPFGGTQNSSTIFLVHREEQRRNAMPLTSNDNVVNNTYILTWNNGRMYQRIQNTWVQGIHGVAVGSPIFYTAVQNPAFNPRRETRVNGATLATNNSNNTGTTTGGTRIGNGWGSRYDFDGWIAEIIIYNRGLNATEVANVEAYLTNKWNNSCGQNVDLIFSKTVSDTTPVEGQNITYTLSVTNDGPGNATTLQILDNLPAGLTLQSLGTPSHGTIVP